MEKIKILYIEDNAENRLLVRRVLETEGYLVLEAEDGISGIRKAKSEQPDLILIDIMMPGLDGREVTTRLRSIPHLEKTPIIALTASVMKGDKERAVTAGCDSYLQKPIDVDRLPDQIEQFLLGKRETLSPEEEVHYLREHNKRLAERLEQKVERLSDISEANKRLVDMSLTDELTGLPNRRYLNRRLREELAMAQRFRSSLSCIMLDLDHFKQINDALGHQAGDAVLQSLAKVLCADKREYDVIGRYGGEEFLVLLPQVDAQGAITVAERLRKRVEETDLATNLRKPVRVTISLGVTTFNEEAINEEDLIRRADEALYRAKARGRNRSVMFGEN
ncbi:MAG: diguanylate cyclase [Nitrospirae bacterium]|nr:diguanylate cyclase [Nitrospirota bacterium]